MLNKLNLGGLGLACPNVRDPFLDKTMLLVRGDGIDAATSFLDSSPTHRTITRVGAPIISSAQSKFGGTSVRVGTSAANNALTIASSSSLDVPTADFTVEAWIYFTATTSQLIAVRATGTGFYSWIVFLTASPNKVQFQGYNAADSALYFTITGATTLSTNTWYFIQCRRIGNTFAIAVNGVQDATTSPGTGALDNGANPVCVGGYSTGSTLSLQGYIDDFRYTVGKGRDFVLPGLPLPAIG